jgi:histidinol dehydrogenase
MLSVHVEGTAQFDEAMHRFEGRGASDLSRVEPAVRAILGDVRARGDAAVNEYVERFEKRRSQCLVRPLTEGATALERLPSAVRDALVEASKRIRRYHERQRLEGFSYEEGGVELGMRVRPLARVGVYAPGGKARYPSSVLMSAIPASVAGVRDIVLATPAADDVVLAAAHLSGVTTLLDAGGAQAIAAMAYGTASLPRVDKIVGPGNAYVACAKRLVFGDVAIDGIAGPSEILVLADETASPDLVAADLLSQAEHDEEAYAILITTSAALVERVERALAEQLRTLSRTAMIEASLANNGAAFVVKDRTALARIAERLAGEHVALHVRDPRALANEIPSAGALLLGAMTPVAVGDYFAGPSHVLPTGGAVRFGSPLGTYDFVARTSLVRYDRAALAKQAHHITTLARAEGLDAHAAAVDARLAQAGATPNHPPEHR